MTSGTLPPVWLLRPAVAAVWLYEGLWCKLLRGQRHEFAVVAAVPYFGPRIGVQLLMTLGLIEVTIAGWALYGHAARVCALVQTLLLVGLNSSGLVWARHIIADPAGMIIKNFAFLLLVWTAASLPEGWA